MAKSGGGARGRSGRRTGSARPARLNRTAAPRTTAKGKTAKPSAAAPAAPAPPPATRFVLGVIPGATAGGWVDAWRERMPRTELQLLPLDVASQRTALLERGLDAALVRLPIAPDGLSVIALYEETAVVVTSADSHLTAVDELELADLAGEILIVPRDDVLGTVVPGAVPAAFAAPEDTEQAIATVAAGVGIVIVPMSLARLHRRKDAAYRPLRDGPTSTVALAWPTDRTSPEVEAFIGIVRGRTPNSSRG
ncbi:LysR family substrate-binding domain-containing protein [Microbacterium sp. zg.B48]|uniref:LysR family substrate-binding domain-containing protein n=1 Tax=unclassified Microbacterium TaxID=2609290 RepID=UPI00214AF12F|nr:MULTISPECIES: LysR family substrate-binding domain-containing protein [unclassified Microbacterium]MCR2763170.1 LysR family substrate-binding domain-containing protein [Microbacterium sp. zg.B48]MCR2808759.1 LysR family substrate-binding domain-containing protein [Microbacterium sp. zg.B185]WIM18813.1 LysR family substrate-binding domain-containing protein [Microbacterium sp. zg-B185]